MTTNKERNFEYAGHWIRIKLSSFEDCITIGLNSNPCEQAYFSARHFGLYGSIDDENFIDNIDLDDLQSDIEDWIDERAV